MLIVATAINVALGASLPARAISSRVNARFGPGYQS